MKPATCDLCGDPLSDSFSCSQATDRNVVATLLCSTCKNNRMQRELWAECAECNFSLDEPVNVYQGCNVDGQASTFALCHVCAEAFDASDEETQARLSARYVSKEQSNAN